MIKINLIPLEFLEKEERKKKILLAGSAGVALLVAVGLVSFQHWNKVVSKQKRLDTLQQEVRAIQTTVDQVQEIEKSIASIQSRLDVIQSLLKGRTLYPNFMEDLVRHMTAGVWLSSLNTQQTGADSLKLQMSVTALSQNHIAEWLRTLEQSDRFTEVNLSGAITSQETAQAGQPVTLYSFNLGAMYKNPRMQ